MKRKAGGFVGGRLRQATDAYVCIRLHVEYRHVDYERFAK